MWYYRIADLVIAIDAVAGMPRMSNFEPFACQPAQPDISYRVHTYAPADSPVPDEQALELVSADMVNRTYLADGPHVQARGHAGRGRALHVVCADAGTVVAGRCLHPARLAGLSRLWQCAFHGKDDSALRRVDAALRPHRVRGARHRLHRSFADRQVHAGVAVGKAPGRAHPQRRPRRPCAPRRTASSPTAPPGRGRATCISTGACRCGPLSCWSRPRKTGIRTLSHAEGLGLFVQQSSLPLWEPELFEAGMRTLEKIITGVPMGMLSCLPDAGAVECVAKWIG